VLDSVAKTLRLDQAERDHLFRLAEVPLVAPPGQQCQPLAPQVQQILDGMPRLPACVLNDRFDLRAWNAPFATLFPGLVSAPAEERNTLWMTFTHPACCHPYVNRHEQLSSLVAQLRGAYGKHVGEPAWTGFVQQLQAASPEFARLWAEHEVAGSASYLKIFRHPRFERLAMVTTSLAVTGAPGNRVVVYTPADEACRAALDSLLDDPGADAHFGCWQAHHRLAAAAG
jgi:hypothetical protein